MTIQIKVYFYFQKDDDSRSQVLKDIWQTVQYEIDRKDSNEEDIHSKDEGKKIKSRIERYLSAQRVITSQHLQNFQQIVRHLMVFENMLKRVDTLFPKLEIKLDDSDNGDRLKQNFKKSLHKVLVCILVKHLFGSVRSSRSHNVRSSVQS